MNVTVAQICRAWPSNVADSSFNVLIYCGENRYINDIIPSIDPEFIANHINKLIYICDIQDAPNNVIPGTGRVMTTWDEERQTLTIREVQNNHHLGDRVIIDA